MKVFWRIWPEYSPLFFYFFVQVVEYSEISASVSERRRDDGSLVFNASNICMHYFNTNFLNDVCTNHLDELPHHIAKKKIPYVDTTGDML